MNAAIIASAVDICDRALAFAVPRAPWLALRARLTRPHRGDDVDLAESLAEVFFEGEPRDIESEHSALASFQSALLGSAAGRPAGYIPARSIEWMRHAVRLRGDDYWYQFFLANRAGRARGFTTKCWCTIASRRHSGPTAPGCVTAEPDSIGRRGSGGMPSTTSTWRCAS